MEDIFYKLANDHPTVSMILMGIGTFRLVFKPLMTFLHQFADATASTRDNELLGAFEGSKAYKALAWVLDYVASVKLPVKK